MKKPFGAGIVTLMVSLCMCCLSFSLVAADSWAESVEYYADETERFEDYWTDEDESDELEDSYIEEEYYSDDSDDELSDFSEETNSDPENYESEAESLDSPVIEETVSSDESVFSVAEDAMLEGDDVGVSGSCGDKLTWKLTGPDSDLTLTITGTGEMWNYNSNNTHPGWWSSRSAITAVILPDGINNIGNCAFYKCSCLVSISIPDGVMSIGDWAFSECSSLTSITIPDGLTSIGNNAFSECCRLENITIPDSVKNIGYFAFYDCSSLKRITIPEGMTRIEDGVFNGCASLERIMIPDSMKKIGMTVFYRCSSLKSITIPDSVTSIGSGAFSQCSSLTNISIPDGVTRIWLEVFRGCKNLTNITIPDGVTSIEKAAFQGCTGLKNMTIPNSVTSIVDYAFRDCSSMTNITIPNSVTSIGTDVFKGHGSSLTIYGKRGSSIEKYAVENKIKFVDPVRLEYASVSGITTKNYTGKELTQSPVVKLAGKTLKLNTDYYMAYKNNINPGKATIAVKGMGNYSGVKVSYFTVKPTSVAQATITNIVSKVYTGKALTQTPVIKIGAKTLKLNADYYLAYKNNINTGRATIAIKGKGNYTGVAVRYFAVKPKPSWIDKLTTPKTKQVTIKWGKQAQISGYQLEISTKKDFGSAKMQKNVYDPAKLSMTVTVAKAKTTYYVRIRTFKKTKDKTYFSAWSATKTIKTK